MRAWEAEELSTIDFGDTRLNKRSQQILKKFFNAPNSSINGTFNGWGETKASYRFFDNKKVSSDKIALPHKEATLERISKHEVVLCIQDTTIVDYSHRKKAVTGLGELCQDWQQGFLLHPTIAFSDTGLCLGVLDYKIWIREKLQGKKLRQVVKPIEEKESIRWIESYRLTDAIASNYGDKLFINIADREGDFYEFLQEYTSETRVAHLIVRAKSNRVLSLSEVSDEKKLWSKLERQPSVGVIEFEMSEIINKRKNRKVVQTIRACKVQIDPPRKVKKLNNLRPIEITAILCKEENPPSGEKAVEWLLLTSLELGSGITALDVVRYYQLRWQIEIYFKVLKSGCRIEALQLGNIDRLKNCIAMYMIIAWRILFLTLIGRFCPEISCELFYNESEWKAVYIIAYRKKPPETAPSIYLMNRTVASFGGFMNRKNDNEPGPKSMWIGLQRLKDFTLAFEIFNATNPTCG